MEFKKQYEEMNMTNLGRPFYFDPDLYLDAVENMIVADEIIFALKMLDNMPAWYRKHPPQRAVEMRKDLLAKVWTVFDYSRDADELETMDGLQFGEDIRYYPRLSILRYFVSDLIYNGHRVNIYEFCPGNFSVIKYLHALGLDFGYKCENVNQKTIGQVDGLLALHPIKDNGFNIFINFEVIEHLWDAEITLEHWASRVKANAFMISTPFGCMGGGRADWNSRELGHVRTFTEKELMDIVQKIWPGKHYYHVLSTMQVAIGSDIPIELRHDKFVPPALA